MRCARPWPNDFDTQTWPRNCQNVQPHQKWSFYVNWFKRFSLNRQTDRQTDSHRHYENITSTAYARGKNCINEESWCFWRRCRGSPLVLCTNWKCSRTELKEITAYIIVHLEIRRRNEVTSSGINAHLLLWG